jgi:glycosyltransferase involved in cell wall biosynthesis
VDAVAARAVDEILKTAAMINVLHLRDTDRVCGPGKTIIETACATDARQFSQKVGLFLLNHETSNAYFEAAVRRGVEVIPVRAAHPYDPRMVGAIVRLIKQHDIHVLHSHEYKSDLLAYLVARVHRIPIMTTIHGWIAHSFKRRLFIGLSQRALPRFDRVVAVSAETRRRILACGVPEHKLVTIHNGIVAANYQSADQAPGYLRQRFALPADATIVGNIGRLSPEKGQHDFLTAVAQIAPRFPRAYFVVVGDGPDRAALEQRVRALSLERRVFFTGFLPDVRPVFRDLDILALTSHTEGFPNVVLESLCMETPVLATAVGGTPEIVRDGDTGVLIPAHAPDRIAAGLSRLLDDPAWSAALAARGRSEVVRHFSFDARVRREEQIYRELCAGQDAGAGERLSANASEMRT